MTSVNTSGFGAIPSPGSRKRRTTGTAGFTGGFGVPVLGQEDGVAKVPSIKSVERPGFELAFGFLPTVNVGNIFGVENDTGRFLMNMFLDPIALGTMFLTGGLSAAGKVAKATQALNSSAGFFSVAGKMAKVTKGANAASRVRNIENSLQVLAKAQNVGEGTLNAVRTSIKAGDVQGTTRLMRQIRKTKLDDDVLKMLPTKEDLFKLDDLANAERIFKNIHGAGTAATGQLDELLKFGALGGTRIEQMNKGQRAFLQFRAGGLGYEKTLIKGSPLWAGMDKMMPVSKILDPKYMAILAKSDIDAKDLRDLTSTLFEINGSKIVDATVDASKVKAAQLQAFQRLLPEGSDMDALGSALTFFREGKGVPVTIAKAAGLVDEGTLIRKARLKGGVKGSLEFVDQKTMKEMLDKKGLSAAFKKSDKVLDEHFETFRKLLNDSDLDIDIPFIESYITHFWDISAAKATDMATKISKSAVFLNKRKFNSFITGLSKGFTPKFTNAFDIGEQYAIHAKRVMANRQLISTLGSDAKTLLINNQPVRIMESAKRLARLGVSDQYTEITNPRILNLLTKQVKGRAPQRRFAPKQMARDLEAIFGKKWDNAAAEGLDKFNAVSKILSLSFSMFHSMALTESAMATMGKAGATGLKEAAKLGFGIPGARKALLKVGVGKNHVALTDDATIFARKMGVEIGTPSDVQVDMLRQGLMGMADGARKIAPGFDLFPKAIAKLTGVMNEALWKNFHEPLKLIGFKNRMEFLRKSNPGIADDVLGRQAASFINDAFGGQNWKQLMVHPKFKQGMHWALLAPDWTISNLRIAGVGSTGVSGAVRGVLGAGRNPKEELVGAYWRGALPVFFASYALLNKSMSGNWPWDNAPGHKFDVALGTRDEKGRPEFMKLGKQFREPFRWLMEPDKIFGAKLAPGIQTVVEQFSKHSTTGFPTEFADKQGGIPMTIMESVPKRLKSFSEKFVPFSFRGNSILFAFPKSSYSETNAIKALRDAVEGSKGTGASAQEIRDILRFSSAAGHDLARIKGVVRREIGDPRKLLDQDIETMGVFK